MTNKLTADEERMFTELNGAIELAARTAFEVLSTEAEIMALEERDHAAAAAKVADFQRSTDAVMDLVAGKLEALSIHFLGIARGPGEQALDFEKRIFAIVMGLDPERASAAMKQLQAIARKANSGGRK